MDTLENVMIDTDSPSSESTPPTSETSMDSPIFPSLEMPVRLTKQGRPYKKLGRPSTWRAATEGPLLDASKRLKKPWKRRKDAKLTIEEQGIAIGMRAVGVPENKVASALAVKASDIANITKMHPELRDRIAAIRDQLKMTKMQKALFLEERLWNLADDKITEGDAKAVDGVMRAIHASEKIQQSVAGESQKVEVKQSGGVTDLAGLIQVLIQQ
jgi:NACalpha-BTF3-like transcription factor